MILQCFLLVQLSSLHGFLLDPLNPHVVTMGRTIIDLKTRDITLMGDDGKPKLHGNLGMTFPADTPDPVIDRKQDSSLTVSWPEVADLHIRVFVRDGIDCTSVLMEARICVTQVIQDCFSMEGAHWYGGAEMYRQLWPLEKVSLDYGPYVTEDNALFPYGSVQERYFFSSSGVAFYIDEEVPLYVAINASGDHRLCFQAKFTGLTYRNYDSAMPVLNYTVCQDKDVLSIHKSMSGWYFRKPDGIPSEDVLRKPIWSTWPEYKKTINQPLALEFAAEIMKYHMDISNFEIDEKWMPNFGDIEFDLQKFPDPKAMIAEIHRKGMASTFWISPFVNLDSSNFVTLAEKGYLLKDISGQRPAFSPWWEAQYTGVIDFTNPNATKWYLDNLDNLRTKYGIDSFKFDGGDVNYMPVIYKPFREYRNPVEFSRSYVEAIGRLDNSSRRHEVRPGARTQHIPAFVRMLDRFSNWSVNHGFQTIITTALVFGILGYPFVLPGMIGGNHRNNVLPDAELFVRWLQATTLMPSMQFGLKPWRYSSTIVSITQDMLKLRARYADKIVDLAKESVTTGAPIIRPLWWLAPTDESALTVDDEFLLGNDLLVAPVMEPGVTERKIYLPAGTWRDEIKGGTLTGDRWMNYPVKLEDLPHFTKLA